MAKKKFHYHKKQNKRWFEPYLSKQSSQNYALRDAVRKWEQENGRKLRRALSDDNKQGGLS